MGGALPCILSESEVSDLDVAFRIDEDIFRFEVTVNDFLTVNVVHAI